MSNSLSEILQGIEFHRLGNLPSSVAALSVNSKELAKGALFFAIRGAKDDGHKYVKNAIQNGASAVVVEEVVADESIPQIIVADTKTALSKAAANFYDNPTNNMTIVGVTGTNGKTTTVYLLNEIFKEAGLKHGTVGTLGYSIGDERFSSNLTVSTVPFTLEPTNSEETGSSSLTSSCVGESPSGNVTRGSPSVPSTKFSKEERNLKVMEII